jgi:hypothetical protein
MARLGRASGPPEMIFRKRPVSDRQASPCPVVFLSLRHLRSHVNDWFQSFIEAFFPRQMTATLVPREARDLVRSATMVDLNIRKMTMLNVCVLM